LLQYQRHIDKSGPFVAKETTKADEESKLKLEVKKPATKVKLKSKHELCYLVYPCISISLALTNFSQQQRPQLVEHHLHLSLRAARKRRKRYFSSRQKVVYFFYPLPFPIINTIFSAPQSQGNDLADSHL